MTRDLIGEGGEKVDPGSRPNEAFMVGGPVVGVEENVFGVEGLTGGDGEGGSTTE